MRMAVTPIVHKFTNSLHKQVYSGQLQVGGPGWHFKKATKATERLRTEISDRTTNESFSSLLKTDIASFYPSVSADLTAQVAHQVDTSGKHIIHLQHFFAYWEEQGLAGLPIGPEVSLLLANGALRTLDGYVIATGHSFARYTDDVYVLNLAPGDTGVFLQDFDQALKELGLNRNLSKTAFTVDRSEAMEWVNDSALASAASALRTDQVWGEVVTAAIFDQEIESEAPNPRRISYSLKVAEPDISLKFVQNYVTRVAGQPKRGRRVGVASKVRG